MSKIYLLAASLLVCLLISMPPVQAQSSRSQAKRWFNLGLREKNPNKKITDFEKAIAYDSLFTEALYQLGHLYLQQKDYARAESYLRKAGESLRDPTKLERKAEILYELATVCKMLGQLQEAETALREAKMLAQDPKLQILLSFDLAAVLQRQGRIAGALNELLDEVENQNYGGEADSEKADAARMQAIYARAQKRGADGDWENAVVAYDSLLRDSGALAIAARAIKADPDSKTTWPLSAAVQRHERGNSFVYIGAVAALVVLPLLGFIFFSTAPRIAFHRWRKDHLAAVKAFEKLLERNPEKINVYAPLAELYLRLGRRDERALKVYKMVLQLNLATPKRDEINAIVAQKYLAEGRTDSEVIDVLESALKSELRNQRRLLAQGA
jgi:tetratricopeptide (TPR) repeat protein